MKRLLFDVIVQTPQGRRKVAVYGANKDAAHARAAKLLGQMLTEFTIESIQERGKQC